MFIEYNTNSISVISPKTSDFSESVFFQGNGYMGARGFACEDLSFRPHQKGIYMAGVFDQLKPGITDIVNTPNFLSLTICIGQQTLDTTTVTGFCQTLSFSDGVLTREYVAAFGQKRLQIRVSRFLSLYDVHSAGIRIELTPLNFEGELTITASIDANSCNLPVTDDQVKKNSDTVQYLELLTSTPIEYGGWMVLKTKTTDITLMQAFGIKLSDNIQVLGHNSNSAGNCLNCSLTFNAQSAKPYVLDKLITVFTSRDVAEDRIQSVALNHLHCNMEKGYEKLYSENQAEWSARWEFSDIEITGDIKAQCAIRYNIFQLIGNNAREDAFVSIGARGLTHARYKGCYFWDTEIFMLPFYIYTDPPAAKNLLLYRYHTLKDARKHARNMSSKGARYPWMASFDGSEQCESWDIGACEVHVTCDVVYAIDKYIRVSADTQFLLDYAAEIYVETARFWQSRFTYDKRLDRYNMLFVKGPDEYCGSTQNNTFTNIMAVYNLNLALNTLKLMKDQYVDRYNTLSKVLGITEDEVAKWTEITQKVAIPYDEEKDLYLQDDTFLLLEPMDVLNYKTDNKPLYYQISFDRLQRYRVLKQADLVLLMVLFPERFSVRQKKAVWDFYEPLTLHDSSLSYGIHAQLAAQLGENDKAWYYLQKSLYLDLENIMDNTGTEGLHLAAFGATWQAVVHGFAGVSVEEGISKVSPNLPKGWKSLCFTIYHKGQKMRITVEQEDRQADKQTRGQGLGWPLY